MDCCELFFQLGMNPTWYLLLLTPEEAKYYFFFFGTQTHCLVASLGMGVRPLSTTQVVGVSYRLRQKSCRIAVGMYGSHGD